MIRDCTGSLFDSRAHAWVNPVNTVGVSGAGLAREFAKRFPAMRIHYERACRAGHFDKRGVLAWRSASMQSPMFVICAATKNHWRNPSTIERIDFVAEELAICVKDLEIHSIAIPALGCGLGGLAWEDVRPHLVIALSPLDLEVELYGPQ